MTKENLRIAFDILDFDHSGYLDINEFKITLPSKNFGKAHCEDQDCQDLEHQEDNEKWIELLKDVEQNDDGLIEFEQFCTAVTRFIDHSYDKLKEK